MRCAALLAAIAAAVPALADAVPRADDAAVQHEADLTVNGTLTIRTPSGPRVRLEQDTSLGRPPYTWDFGGDDREFFVIDLTGFRIPVRIATGIPSGEGPLGFEAVTGDLAVGADFPPLCPLHLWHPEGGESPQLLVEEASATVAARNLVRVRNNGPSNIAFSSSFNPVWAAGSGDNGSFFIRTIDAPALELSQAGNLTLAGVLTQLSDRGAKQDIEALDVGSVLDKVRALPLATWSYEGDRARHVGPMAQDFAAAFGLGSDDRHVAPSDLAGVGLAAVQAIRAELQGVDARLGRTRAALDPGEAQWSALQDRLAALEARLRPGTAPAESEGAAR